MTDEPTKNDPAHTPDRHKGVSDPASGGRQTTSTWRLTQGNPLHLQADEDDGTGDESGSDTKKPDRDTSGKTGGKLGGSRTP